MGHLADILAETRIAAPHSQPLWGEGDPAAWLLAAPADFASQRAAMVAGLRRRLPGLAPGLDATARERALAAMTAVPREAFLCPLVDDFAYLPIAPRIGLDQTMSHPEMVAVLAAGADPQGGVVLDVGTGSGYQAAVLAQLAARVVSVEIRPGHAALAARRLARLTCANVEVHTGDGASGAWLGPLRYDAIVVAAGASTVPRVWLDALRIGGRLVMPVGPDSDSEWLVRIERTGRAAWRRTRLCPAKFVPLAGAGARSGAG